MSVVSARMSPVAELPELGYNQQLSQPATVPYLCTYSYYIHATRVYDAIQNTSLPAQHFTRAT